MKRHTFILTLVCGILLFGSLALSETGRNALLMPGDSDHDGVPDAIDQCPSENASFFDRNGDGCIDDAASARHIEFWTKDDLPFVYYINADGAAGIADGSDFTAIQNGILAWSLVQGVTFPVSYAGTSVQQDASATDKVNLVTFKDDEYQFGTYTIAVAISTSYTVDTEDDGELYRPGQIFDADIIFNPAMKFRTPTAGTSGMDIRSVVTHEAGHLFGISHSPVKTSAMFFVLPPRTEASSLETEDAMMFYKAYGDSMTIANGSRIAGTVTSGKTNEPMGGAIVFAISTASGDTVAADYTMPDGGYTFPGLPDGDYYIAIHQIDTSAAIGYLEPRFVNSLVETMAVLRFPPEYYDDAESSSDDPTDKTAITIAAGSKHTDIDLVTNIDVTAPTVVSITPAGNASSVKIDAAIKIRFSEAMDDESLKGNFSLVDAATQIFISGKGIFLQGDSVLAFTPSQPFDFSKNYTLTLKTGLTDQYENGLAQQYTTSFTTQPMPPVAITSLCPNKGVVGTIVVINGIGFDPVNANNLVLFGDASAQVLDAFPNRLVVLVPQNAPTASSVTVGVGEAVSDEITFTVLSATEIARGFESGIADLNARPRSITVLPEGGYAYLATDQGAAAVVVDPGIAGYLDVTPIDISGGLDAMEALPDGKLVYAVSRANERLYVIDSDPTHGALFNEVIAEFPLRSEPLGITVDPAGGRAFIPTSDGEIQVWDVRKGSETCNSQIGAILPPDPNIRGRMAIDPTGDYLLCLSGAGKLYTYDLGPDTLYATSDILMDPRDVVVDPTGQHAFVSDGTGNISVVPLSGLFTKSQDINAGGSLRGMTITPAGLYLYACNRQLNLIDVIDLNEDGPHPRSLIATVEVGYGPVDIDLSPDGYYAFSAIEGSEQLVVTTIGLGPGLKSLSRRGGPWGTKLVLAGVGFGADINDIRVQFPDSMGGAPLEVMPEYSSGTSLTVTVPVNAASGPVRIVKATAGEEREISNALYFQVLGVSHSGGFRLAEAVVPVTGMKLAAELSLSPTGDFLLITGVAGDLSQAQLGLFDTDPSSITYDQFDSRVVNIPLERVHSVAVTPDGERAYLTSSYSDDVLCYNVNRHSSLFGAQMGAIDVYGSYNMTLAMSPDGELLVVSDRGYPNPDSVSIVDILPGSTHENEVIAGLEGITADDIVFHPGGRYAYIAQDTNIVVVDLDPGHAQYLHIVNEISLQWQWVVRALSFTPDGEKCLALAHSPYAPCYGCYNPWFVSELDVSDPATPVPISYIELGNTRSPSNAGCAIDVSPRGDRAVVTMGDDGYYNIDLTAEPDTVVGHYSHQTSKYETDLEFTPDGSRIYVAGTVDTLLVYDFNAADNLSMISGNEQSGVIGEELPAPLRVFVGSADSLMIPVPGVPITFEVFMGGGYFTDSHLTKQVIATDQSGYAEIDWTLGSIVGAQTQGVQVRSEGLIGSPMQFIADSYDDPLNLPLMLSEVLPLPETNNVGVTTSVQGAFSRAVDPASIGDETFYLTNTADTSLVSATVGYADEGRRVSLMPTQALEYGTRYTISVTRDIYALDGDSLQNPGDFQFSTAAKPPLVLLAVTPPSATASACIVLSGRGFDPVAANDKVLFNDEAAVPFAAGVDYMKVEVPSDAITGTIRVVCGADTSNARPFTMLVPNTSPVDEVLATIGTGSSVKSVAVTPDGGLAYSVSPDADIVIPIDVDGQTTYSSISVGDNPVAVAIHPDNTYAYVANFGSGTVSVICVNPDSARFNEVVETITVGTNPIDVAVRPDGDRIYVANLGSSNLSVIDGDGDSESQHMVLATVTTGSSAKSVAVTPDGTRVFVGTNTGYVVVETSSNAVTATVSTGSSTKSISVTPDGGLLIVVTTEGTIVIYDVAPGSSTPNKVLATITTGSSVRSVAVTPDGAMLYVILEDGDKAIAYSLTVIGSSSVLEPETPIPPCAVMLTPIDTIPTGKDPACIAFDPSGSGLAIVCNAGDNTVTFLNTSNVPAGALAAEVEVTPRTLNLQSYGRWVTGRIELSSGYRPEEIDVASVLLQDAIPAVPGKVEFEDIDQDGLSEIVLKFDRAAFQAILPQGEYVPVTLAGVARNRAFMGVDTIRTIRPTVTHPCGGVLTMGDPTNITWTSPKGFDVDSVSVDWTPDDGGEWHPIARRIPDTHSCPWQVPMLMSDSCRVMITLFANGEILGMGMSQDEFMISVPVAVTVGDFTGAFEKEAAVIRWSTVLEQNIDGFNVLRAENESGSYERINAKSVPSARSAGGGRYDFRDTIVTLNKSYFYKLEEVSGSVTKVIAGPYEVVCRAPFELAQNVPNPFNPVTSIRFTLPEDGHVTLAVYDISGRRIKTLIDKDLKADFYRVEWNGKNDRGRRVTSGIYFYRIRAGRHTESRKMILLR